MPEVNIETVAIVAAGLAFIFWDKIAPFFSGAKPASSAVTQAAPAPAKKMRDQRTELIVDLLDLQTRLESAGEASAAGLIANAARGLIAGGPKSEA